jgi:peptidoglycan DL-endopeptidase CwlO
LGCESRVESASSASSAAVTATEAASTATTEAASTATAEAASTATTEATATATAEAASTATAEATATAAASARLREIKSDCATIDLLTVEFHGISSVGWVLELNVAETAWSSVFAHSDTDLRDLTSSSEELEDGVLFSLETEVSAKDGVGLA